MSSSQRNSVVSASFKCCSCNPLSGLCKNCICVRSGIKCTSCGPISRKRCHNSEIGPPIFSQPNYLEPPPPDTQQHSLPVSPPPPLNNIIQKFKSPIIKFIPKPVRLLAAKNFLVLTDNIIKNPEQMEHWTRFFLFPFLCLKLPVRSGSKINNSNFLQSNIKSFENLTYQHMLSLPDKRTTISFKSKVLSSEGIIKSVCSKIEDGNIRSAVKLLTEDASLADPSGDTLKKLLEKHPKKLLSHNTETNFSINNLSTSVEEVKFFINKFPKGSAGGVDGLSPQHLKDMFLNVSEGPIKDSNLSRLTKFIEFLLNTDIPSGAREILFGAKLIALKKKDNGVRPIAIGNTIRRLSSKIANKHIEDHLSKYFTPKQFGAGAKCGSEYIVHSTRAFLEKNPQSCFLKIDFSNAFNSVERSHILSEAAKLQIPGLNFIKNSYFFNSKLMFNDHIISSERGVQQGDPLGPVLFCIAIHPIVNMLKCPLNLWYMDDGCLGGTENEVLNDFNTLVTESNKIGLSINKSKCEIFNSTTTNHDFLKLTKTNLHLLGNPVLKDAIKPALEKRLHDFEKLSSSLHLLPTHHAYVILKSSLGVCRVTSMLRSSPCLCTDVILKFDSAICDVLKTVSNVDLSDIAMTQASLPIKMGGMGISLLKHHYIPAYIASFKTVKKLYNINLSSNYINEFHSKWSELSNIPLDDIIYDQKSLTTPIFQSTFLNIITKSSSLTDKSRLQSSSHHFSGDWLHTLPVQSLGLHLSNEEFRIATCLRLGVSIFEPHKCVCGTLINSFGNHCFACKRNNGKILRHSMVNEAISKGLKSGGCPNLLEPNDVHENLRPDGVTTIPFRKGKSLAWDFTCPHPMSDSSCKDNKSCGNLCNNREKRKVSKYQGLTPQYYFKPIAIDTIGAYGKSAEEMIKEIGKRITEFSGQKESGFFLRQRISIAVQRGNAICLRFALKN